MEKELEEKLNSIATSINNIEGDVKVLRGDVGVLKTDVGVLKTDVAELKTDVGVLKTDVAELKTDVGVLKTDVNQLKIDVAVNTTNIKYGFEQTNKEIAEIKETVNQTYNLVDGFSKNVNDLQVEFDINKQDSKRIKTALKEKLGVEIL